MRRIAPIILFGYLAAACAAQSADGFAGRAVAVLDGDSMRVLRDGREVEVRLHGVDAPEGGQAFGNDSRAFLTSLVKGKTVTVEVRDVDQYGRLVGRVLFDGTDAGLEVIRSGHGWHFTRYSADNRYAEAEREARRIRRGLWALDSPVAPWVFREQYGPRERQDASPGTSRPDSAAAGKPRTASGPFHGNVESRVYHAPGCEHYSCKACTEVFATVEAAAAKGYRPHRECVGR